MCCHLVGWAIFGVFIGAIARLIWPGRQAMTLLMTMLVGVAGSLIGGLITWVLTGAEPGGYQPASYLMSIVGALIFLGIYGAGANRRGLP